MKDLAFDITGSSATTSAMESGPGLDGREIMRPRNSPHQKLTEIGLVA
jgi:hypothetical protein